MYYFDILELLEKHKGTKFTSTELFLDLSIKKPIVKKNLDKALYKMFMSNNHIKRQYIQLTRFNPGYRKIIFSAYVYWFAN